jgi:hypothetical protein
MEGKAEMYFKERRYISHMYGEGAKHMVGVVCITTIYMATGQ